MTLMYVVSRISMEGWNGNAKAEFVMFEDPNEAIIYVGEMNKKLARGDANRYQITIMSPYESAQKALEAQK